MRNHVSLAACPVDVVWYRAREQAEEQWLAEGADVDGERKSACLSKLVQVRTELPRTVGIEMGEHEGVFLSDNRLQIVNDVHGRKKNERGTCRRNLPDINAYLRICNGVATQMASGF
jgi:hypothetical protein